MAVPTAFSSNFHVCIEYVNKHMHCSEITQVYSLTPDKNKLNRTDLFEWARGRSEKSEFKISGKKFTKRSP